MKPAAFEYLRADTVEDAVRALAEAADDALPLAGGQSLLPLLGLRMAAPRILVDIGRIADLRSAEDVGERVIIGAATTHSEIEDGMVPDPGRGLMRNVAKRIAYRAVRNQGTIGGSVAMADPAADWPACLLALEAEARVVGPGGARTVAMSQLVVDVYTTALRPGEIIVAFEVPRLDVGARTGVAKVSKKTGAFAMSIAIAILNDGSRPARVVLAGAGPKAMRLPATSDLVQSASPTEREMRSAVARDLEESGAAIDDYALRLHSAVVTRAVAEAHAR
ncbi:FAD binding domain-containing protein [Faunimonas sp. B44]|uniref:FAD binding domain-containing protein n=1 Tax=Faunimonas sp. B44 TaxID=3461493 RepID=UPI0040441D95